MGLSCANPLWLRVPVSDGHESNWRARCQGGSCGFLAVQHPVDVSAGLDSHSVLQPRRDPARSHVPGIFFRRTWHGPAGLAGFNFRPPRFVACLFDLRDYASTQAKGLLLRIFRRRNVLLVVQGNGIPLLRRLRFVAGGSPGGAGAFLETDDGAEYRRADFGAGNSRFLDCTGRRYGIGDFLCIESYSHDIGQRLCQSVLFRPVVPIRVLALDHRTAYGSDGNAGYHYRSTLVAAGGEEAAHNSRLLRGECCGADYHDLLLPGEFWTHFPEPADR